MFDITQSRFPFVLEHEYADGDKRFEWVLSDDFIVSVYDLRSTQGEVYMECEATADEYAFLRELVTTADELDQCLFDWLEYCQQQLQLRFNELSFAADTLEKASVQWVKKPA